MLVISQVGLEGMLTDVISREEILVLRKVRRGIICVGILSTPKPFRVVRTMSRTIDFLSFGSITLLIICKINNYNNNSAT